MPSLLHYEIITGPTSLQASLPGEPSVGTVYVIVSNNQQAAVDWEYIDVVLPLVPGASELTDNPAAVTTDIQRTRPTPRDIDLEFKWDSGLDRFRAQPDSTSFPPGTTTTVSSHGGLILKLENIPVSEDAGLVVLEIHDKTSGGESKQPMVRDNYVTTLGLVKQAPRVPRNFRAEKSLVNGDAGDKLKLLWDGPTDLDYAILDQLGVEVHREQASPGPAAHQQFSPQLSFTPKRGTTYTLVAKPPGVAGHQGHFLTTTVHATIPEFESGTRTQWVEGMAREGRVFFTGDGVDVQDKNHSDLGRLRAKKVDVDSVVTRLVQGRRDEDGWITFPERGVNVYHGHDSTPGVITAARADVDGVNTTWAGSRAAGHGWIGFSPAGATVYKDDTPNQGTLTAEKADLKGLNTQWVGDRDGGNGWIGFPRDGADVHRDGSDNRGALRADSADISDGVDTPWVGDRAGKGGWILFPRDGIDVRKDDDGWGTVAADQASVNELRTGGARVKGVLTVLGGMKLDHESQKIFFTMPDRVIFPAFADFKKAMNIAEGLSVTYGNSNVSMFKDRGMLVSNSNFQLQQGELTISTGNPPQVRRL